PSLAVAPEAAPVPAAAEPPAGCVWIRCVRDRQWTTHTRHRGRGGLRCRPGVRTGAGAAGFAGGRRRGRVCPAGSTRGPGGPPVRPGRQPSRARPGEGVCAVSEPRQRSFIMCKEVSRRTWLVNLLGGLLGVVTQRETQVAPQPNHSGASATPSVEPGL